MMQQGICTFQHHQKERVMHHVKGEQRNQLQMLSLESMVSPDSFVRVIDVFVDLIDLTSFGFKHVDCGEKGRPPFHPAVLLKLYLYGYNSGIRSSRKLAREASLNLEAMWLLSGQAPRYHTIADFRKHYGPAFREIFRRFVFLLKDQKLIEGETIGIDSFKIRAQNSLKNNYNAKKIARHLEYINTKISEYEQALDANDQEEERAVLKAKLARQTQKKAQYEQLGETLKQSKQEQISLTDEDARAVVLHRNIVNVGYNVQASSDAKHKLLVSFDTGDVNDTRALSSIAIDSKELLQLENTTVLADKGYHTGEELLVCQQNNITTYVSPKAPATKDNGLYPITMFIYTPQSDTYTCPATHTLTTNGKWLKHSSDHGQSPFSFKRYTTKLCKQCKLQSQCTTNTRNGRVIDRSEYANAIEANNTRVHTYEDYYRQRQQITEHIYGTLKRQRGFTHTLVKGKEKVLGEVGLMFITYNLTRCANIQSIRSFIKTLRDSVLCRNGIKIDVFSNQMYAPILCNKKMAA